MINYLLGVPAFFNQLFAFWSKCAESITCTTKVVLRPVSGEGRSGTLEVQKIGICGDSWTIVSFKEHRVPDETTGLIRDNDNATGIHGRATGELRSSKYGNNCGWLVDLRVQPHLFQMESMDWSWISPVGRPALDKYGTTVEQVPFLRPFATFLSGIFFVDLNQELMQEEDTRSVANNLQRHKSCTLNHDHVGFLRLINESELNIDEPCVEACTPANIQGCIGAAMAILKSESVPVPNAKLLQVGSVGHIVFEIMLMETARNVRSVLEIKPNERHSKKIRSFARENPTAAMVVNALCGKERFKATGGIASKMKASQLEIKLDDGRKMYLN